MQLRYVFLRVGVLSLIYIHHIDIDDDDSNNTTIQEKKRKLPRNVYYSQNRKIYFVSFRRGKEVHCFGASYDTVEEAEAVAISIRGQLEKESIEIVKKRFDEERVRILCRLLFFSLNSPRV